MRPIDRSEVLRIGEYEAIRDPFRARVIAEKKVRRLALGPNMTAVFENRDTVLMQIQEMLRTERITREAAIVHEIETYNELIPSANELSATIMVEYDEPVLRDAMLVKLEKIEEHIALVIGGEKAPATWQPYRILEGRASAVLYLKFPLKPALIAAIREGKEALLTANHPHYQASTPIPANMLKSLAEDFDN